MKGRKPQPAVISDLTGNGRRPIQDEASAAAGAPCCPDHLSTVAKAEWDRITRELDHMGILTVADRAALAAYCQSWARWVEAEEHLATEGAVVLSPNGYGVQSAWLAIANKAMMIMHKYLTEFGLTPVARTRVHVQEKGRHVADEFAELAAMVETPHPKGRPQ